MICDGTVMIALMISWSMQVLFKLSTEAIRNYTGVSMNQSAGVVYHVVRHASVDQGHCLWFSNGKNTDARTNIAL